MNNKNLKKILTGCVLLTASQTQAQVPSTAAPQALAPADRIVPFRLSDEGVSLPIQWGLDTAWPSEENIRRGVAFMGAENVDIMRASFQPTFPLVDGNLQEEQIKDLNTRLGLIDLSGEKTLVVLNNDSERDFDAWYGTNAERWAQLIDATTRYVQDKGRTVVSVAPYNEPDYGWGQGNVWDFYKIAGELRKNPNFENIRICGGNTLNCDQALPWYNTLKSRLDEGNTHQLAGSFDNYAAFYQAVRANGHHATNDELHNVMEAIVGSEYGMQTGIWWGTAEWTRSEFVRASHGVRLGYAEHRPNWTAAAVYRSPEGKVEAFGGTSERQAVTTTYRFVSLDRDVYYDGQGPQREFLMELPGGTGYQDGQTNAEGVAHITWGDDIQPVINGRYKIVNRKSRKLLTVTDGAMNAGAGISQNTNLNKLYQQWWVEPVSNRVGGDFSYFTLTAVHSNKAIDVLNWSLNDGTSVIAFDKAGGNNQQWFLEYAEDGWFYIRSRHSALCLEVKNGASYNGAAIVQSVKDGNPQQQWRLIPYEAGVEFKAPDAPGTLTAAAGTASVRLAWTGVTDTDLDGYIVLRSETPGGPYNTIARGVQATGFIDNSAQAGTTYYYCVKAVDKSLNRSEASNEVSATPSGEPDLLANLSFENNLQDNTANAYNSVIYGIANFTGGPGQSQALSLDGKENFVQLPATLPHVNAITVAAWIRWRGGKTWQRIFDFGNGEEQYIFLTPRADDGRMRLAAKNGGTEMRLTAPTLTLNEWHHVAVTLSEGRAVIYTDGKAVAESVNMPVSPNDFKPVLNYIGRSQFDDPLLGGDIDDFRVYNYALSGDDVTALAQGTPDGVRTATAGTEITVWPQPASTVLNVSLPEGLKSGSMEIALYDLNGRRVLGVTGSTQTVLNVSALPDGLYTLTVTGRSGAHHKKVLIRH